MLSAQSVTVKTYGISARGVDADTNDIFDLKYNGSKNVGVGTKIYLAGNGSRYNFYKPNLDNSSKTSWIYIGILASQDLDETQKAYFY